MLILGLVPIFVYRSVAQTGSFKHTPEDQSLTRLGRIAARTRTMAYPRNGRINTPIQPSLTPNFRPRSSDQTDRGMEKPKFFSLVHLVGAAD